MSLICSEFEILIPGSQKVYAVSHPIGPGYAVSERAVSRIPEKAKRQERCGPMEEGLDIARGRGTKGKMAGNWQISTFAQGEFLFSISEATARVYLPNTLRRIRADIAEEAC